MDSAQTDRDRKAVVVSILIALLAVAFVLQQVAWNDERDQGAPTGTPYVPTLYGSGSSNN